MEAELRWEQSWEELAGEHDPEHRGATDGSLLGPAWSTLRPHGTWDDVAFLAQSLYCVVVWFFETGLHVTQSGLKLGMLPRMTLNSRSDIPASSPRGWDYRCLSPHTALKTRKQGFFPVYLTMGWATLCYAGILNTNALGLLNPEIKA